MSKFWFYNLADLKPEFVLVALLEKCLKSGQRVIVNCRGDRLEFYNDYLWSYKEDSFLPHDLKSSKNPEQQPIYLTDQSENPNSAVIRIYPDMPPIESLDIASLCEDYKRIIFLFGNFADKEASSKDYEEFYNKLRLSEKTTKYWLRSSSDNKWKSKD